MAVTYFRSILSSEINAPGKRSYGAEGNFSSTSSASLGMSISPLFPSA